MRPGKRIVWLGSSLVDLKAFPAAVVDDLGYQLFLVQCGLDPRDWKPLKAVGAGVKELRVADTAGAFRVVYLAVRPEAIYVLHAFQKKTRKTSHGDIELARRRLNQLPRSP
jgi:phage-related protein